MTSNIMSVITNEQYSEIIDNFYQEKNQVDRLRKEKARLNVIHHNQSIENGLDKVAEEKKEKVPNLQGKINVEIYKNNEYILIKILDNGIGFDDTKNITKPYFTTKKDGTGLGLPIVTKIINEHNGDINFVKNSKGAEVIISIPTF